VTVAGEVRAGLNMIELVRPFSGEFKDKFDESTHVAVLRGGEAVFVDVQETHGDLSLVGRLGARVHFHATAAGKAMAAFFPSAEQEKLLRELPEGGDYREHGRRSRAGAGARNLDAGSRGGVCNQRRRDD